MPFETYVPRRGPGKAEKPTIRILKSGDFSISPAAYDEFFGGAKHAELLYDPKSKKIGIKPRRKPTKASYKIRESPQGGSRRYISGSQFLEHYGIEVDKAKSLEASWNQKDKLVAVSV